MQARIVRRTTYDLAMLCINQDKDLRNGKYTNTRAGCPPAVIQRPEDEWIEVFPFSHRYISDLLTRDRAEKWVSGLDPHGPIFIDAQTGAGKTTFIFNVLYPIIHGLGQKVLYLASRAILKQHIKYDAIKAAGTDQLETLTESGISKEHHFGDVDVYSYQDFEYETYQKEVEKNVRERVYGAVIFDECHFFMADADFNRYTSMIFDFLVPLFSKTDLLRIYMSGTPEAVFEPIYKVESGEAAKRGVIYSPYNPAPPLRLYHFDRDHRYLQVKFISPDPDKELVNQINNSGQGEKWLVFVENTHGWEERLKKLNRSSFLLTADKRNDPDSGTEAVLAALRDNQDIGVDVLVSTKCLDVGVSIDTKNLNIVSFLTDKIDFLQAIGRKRVKGKETVNLYIPTYTDKDLGRWIGRDTKTLVGMKDACGKYPERRKINICDLPNPIYAYNGEYRHNRFALNKLESRLNYWKLLKSRIEESGEPATDVIVKEILSWLNLDQVFPADSLPGAKAMDKERTELKKIRDRYSGTMNEEKFRSLCNDLKEYDPRKDHRQDRDELSTQTVNTILAKIGSKVKVSGSRGNKTYQLIQIYKDGEADE